MRSFHRNSPEAAARVVALVLICDGHVCRSELDALDRLRIEHELRLEPGGFSRVLHVLCEDLLQSAYASDAMTGRIDASTLVALLAEIDDPDLQRRVLRLAESAAGADLHLSEAEAMVLRTARQQWRIGVDEVPSFEHRTIAPRSAGIGASRA